MATLANSFNFAQPQTTSVGPAFMSIPEWEAQTGLSTERYNDETGTSQRNPFTTAQYYAQKYGQPAGTGLWGMNTPYSNLGSYEELLQMIQPGNSLRYNIPELPYLSMSPERMQEIMSGALATGADKAGFGAAFDAQLTPEELSVITAHRNYMPEDDFFGKWGPALFSIGYGALVGPSVMNSFSGGDGIAGATVGAGGAGGGAAGAGTLGYESLLDTALDPFGGGLGASGYGGTAGAGLDAAALEALTGMSGLVGGLPLTQAAAPVGSLTSPGILPGTTSFGTGVLSSGATTGFTGGGIMDELLKLLQKSGMGPGGTVSNLMNIGSGLYGMYESSQMRKLAQQAMQVQDPFGSQRPQYAKMLSELYADPSRITKMPGYEAGLDAVERRMASQGYLGSGNMMAALQKYGGDFFSAEAARLAQLAGAGFGPSGAGQSLLQGNQNANELLSKALASIGYGVRGVFSGGTPDLKIPGIIWN